MSHYTIKNGDTLTKLARKFGTTVSAIAHANNIEDPDKIYVGDSIEVPENQNALQQQVKQLLMMQGAPGNGAMPPQGVPNNGPMMGLQGLSPVGPVPNTLPINPSRQGGL